MKSELPFRIVIGKWGVALVCAVLIFIQGPRMMAQQVTVIRGGTLIDATGAPPLPDAVIVIRGNRIESIGQNSNYPSGARVIDATDKYITPGLWDKHFHYKDWFPEMVVTNGVTSAFMQGNSPWHRAQGEGVLKGKILGPRMFYRTRVNEYQSAVEARRLAREGIAGIPGVVEKPDFVKVYTAITAESLRAVAEEAHRAGLHVEGHIGISARQAALAGIDGLTHATGIAVDVLTPENLAKVADMRAISTGRRRVIFPEIASWDESKIEGPNPDLMEYWLYLEDPRRLMMFGMMDRGLAQDLIDLLVREEVFIEGCIGYTFRNVHDRKEQYEREDHLLLSDPNLHYIPERVRVNVLDYTLLDKLTPDELALMKQGYRNYQWFMKTFVEAGGKIVVGPDTTSINHASMLPGVATVRELELMVDAGISPMQALFSATRWAAEVIGQDEDLGTLEVGKLADLLVLPRNPIEDISVFKDIEMVMQDGRVLDIGYHYEYTNPIPWPAGNNIAYPGFGPVTEIPATLDSISPVAILEGSGDITLTAKGGPWLSTSTIQFGDTMLETELVDSSTIRATVPARLIQNVGTYPVVVDHIPPGWGKTNTRYMMVKFR